MEGRIERKVALVTGAARGIGRSRAIRFAVEGADIIALDVCRDYSTLSYGLANENDLAETTEAAEARGRRVFAAETDVRDIKQMESALAVGVELLGDRLDIVVANAAIASMHSWGGDPVSSAGYDRHESCGRVDHHGRRSAVPDRGRRRIDHMHRFKRWRKRSLLTWQQSTALSASRKQWPMNWPHTA
jgi:NAD(P)-dependent dehydrogenase (short-subunit alcohol dehydrogenase family)